MPVFVLILRKSMKINVICFFSAKILLDAGYFFVLYLNPSLCDATWKTKDRCGNWYSGHAVPSLALCEGETDVNELLSLG